MKEVVRYTWKSEKQTYLTVFILWVRLKEDVKRIT